MEVLSKGEPISFHFVVHVYERKIPRCYVTSSGGVDILMGLYLYENLIQLLTNIRTGPKLRNFPICAIIINTHTPYEKIRYSSVLVVVCSKFR